ncbi:alpha-amylase family protein [Microlunatus panaciterrae]|uniref:Glycosidase n=1 Tax=Microlunatus panaciterrae TaxID=400768 RepID=A0ABS2RKM8_9ACTN|nr:alpha-amylase family protein [Microlunatus panaciterrae]MBM7799218.1 glycosidase [Microlunatus panaciterrae]
MTLWADHAIFWHVYPLGFVGAAKEAPLQTGVAHPLGRFEGWLDYLTDLGCSGLMLGPIFASASHGYDTVDHFRIDPRLGDDADFERLQRLASEHGLHLVLDGVFNHVGRAFPKFVEAECAPESAAGRWFRRRDGGWDTFEGHDQLVCLNHDEPEVLDYVVQVLRHWLDRGASGWRLDAAYAVPTGFWRKAIEQVRETHPEAWFVAEVIHGDYGDFARASGVDSVTQYELWKAIWSSLNDGNFFELEWTLQRHNDFLASTTPLIFVGNHDVTRIGTRVEDERRLQHALVALLTVGGIPSIYAGDEQAFRGVKEDRVGGDDAVRPEFPPTPGGLAPFGWATYRLHQRLIGLRRRHPWLVRARTETLQVANESLAFRTFDPDHPARQLVVLLNIGASAVSFDLQPGGLDRLEGSGEHSGDVVEAHGWRILGSH